MVKWAWTRAIAAAASASRASELRSSTFSSARASADGSFGGTSQPVTSGRMISGAAPWFGAITGLPIACASATTRPNASGSVEAETTTSDSL